MCTKMILILSVFSLVFSIVASLDPCENVGELKPDTKQCDHFYQCTEDGWVSLQCRPPTLFNPKILNCDWPKNVDCAKISLKTAQLGLDPCENVGELKPDTKQCDHFYQCTEDGWVSLQCQSPTLFNPKILNCDWPKNVECAKISLKSAQLGLDPCENVGELKPDTKQCDHFYQCTEDGWVSLQCQSPTLFNPKILNCDWPKNVECAKISLKSAQLGLDPCENVGELKPDTKQCDHFYQCTEDGWVSLQCQSPTLFNPKILNCDWPKNVECAKISLKRAQLGSDPCELVGELKPDTERCNHFYQCTEDGWVNLQCQPPTLFNPKILVCDWPKNVICAKAN